MNATMYALLGALLFYAVLVLFPLVPAVLIYKVFPKDNFQDGVRGVLGKLTINATGAFAAYIIVLLVLATISFRFGLIPSYTELQEKFYEQEDGAWTVNVDLQYYDGGRRLDRTSIPSNHELQVALRPERCDIKSDNIVFLFDYRKRHTEPWLHIECRGFKAISKKIWEMNADSSIRFNHDQRKIFITGLFDRDTIPYAFKENTEKTVLESPSGPPKQSL